MILRPTSLALAAILSVIAHSSYASTAEARFVLTCTDCQHGGTFTDTWVTPFDATLDPGYVEYSPKYFFLVEPTSNIYFFAHSALYGGGYNYGTFSNSNEDAFAPGSVIYTGPTSAPVWKVGTYTDVVNYFHPGQNDGTSTLTISAVPEAATWALMLVGFGGLGVALRSRRRTAAAATA